MPETDTVSLAFIDFKQKSPKCTNLEGKEVTETDLEYNLIFMSKEDKAFQISKKEKLNLHISFYIEYGRLQKGLTCLFEKEESFSKRVKSYAKVNTFSQGNKHFVFIELEETTEFQISNITVFKKLKTLNVFNIILNCESPYYSTRTREFLEPITHQIAKGKLDPKFDIHYLNIGRFDGDSIQEEVFNKHREYSFYFSKSQQNKSLSYLLDILSDQEEAATGNDSVSSMDNNKVSMNHSVQQSKTLSACSQNKNSQQDNIETNKIQDSKLLERSYEIQNFNTLKEPLSQIDLNKPKNNLFDGEIKSNSLLSTRPQEKSESEDTMKKEKNFNDTSNKENKIAKSGDSSKNNFVHNKENLQPNRNNFTEMKTFVPPNSNHKYSSVGLPRIKNSCYLNAVLQCLFNAVNLVYDFEEKSKFNFKQGKSAIQIFFGILDAVQNCDISKAKHHKNILENKLSDLKEKVGEHNPTFKDYGQKDAYEFLMNLLECFSNDLKYTGTDKGYINSNSKKNNMNDPMARSNEHYQRMLAEENNIVTLLFRGQLGNMMTCNECKKTQSYFEPLWALCLGLNKSKDLNSMTLKDLLDDFKAQETFNCDCNGECQKETSHSSHSLIWRFPNILVITFKKFKFINGRYQKIDFNLEYPVENLIVTEIAHESENGSMKEPNYMLFGVINHSGSLEYGHYTADCLNFSENKWYHFDDYSVEKSRIQAGMKKTSGDPSVLLYIRKSYIKKFKADSKINDCNMF